MRKELYEENRLTAGQGLPGMEYEEGIKDFKNLYRMQLFLWRIDEIVMALLNAGLTLTSLKEYPYANDFNQFEGMYSSGRHWYLPPEQPGIPLMFSISARK